MTVPDGAVIRAHDAEPIFIMLRGRRHLIVDAESFFYLGFVPADIAFKTMQELGVVPVGPHLPSFKQLQDNRSDLAAVAAGQGRADAKLDPIASESKLWRSWTLAIFAAVAIAAVLAIGIPHLVPYSRGLSPEGREAAVGAMRSSLIQLFAAIGVTAGLGLTWHANRINRRSVDASGFAQLGERFTRSLELASSNDLTQKVGGILSLARIARVSSGDQKAVATLCTAALLKPGGDLFETRVVTSSLAEIRQSGYRGKYDLRELTLDNVELSDLNFSYSDLRRSRLANVSALYSRLEDSTMIAAEWTHIDLRFSDLKRSIFRGSRLSGDLSLANLESTVFVNSSLVGVTFAYSTMLGSVFAGCDLQRANFSAVNLSSTRFIACDLRGAIADSQTQWPADFNPKNEGFVFHRS